MDPSPETGFDQPAARDPLSGLRTRESFERGFARRAGARRTGERDAALLLLAVDQCESVQSRFGRHVWEQALELFGRIIKGAVTPSDLAARYDECTFVLLLDDASEENLRRTAARIRDAVERANAAAQLPAVLGLRIGWAAGGGLGCDELVARARASLGEPAGPPLPIEPAAPLARASILIVDGEAASARRIAGLLADAGAAVSAEATAEAALRHLHHDPIDVVIADLRLPVPDGLELLKQVRRVDPAKVVILLTGSRDLGLAIRAIRCGADDYLTRPFTPQDLLDSVTRGLRKRQLVLSGRAYQAMLEAQVEQRTRELQQVVRHLESTYRATLKALGAALDTRDVETHAHSERVAQYALTLGRVLGMGEPDLVTLERGVYLHDIGKIGIPDRVLLKHGSLDETEWEVMRQHCQLGYRLASRVDFLKGASRIILTHHERFDGRGYPFGLRGEEIPLGARVFAVVDALDAITSDRPYRRAKPFEDARAEIRRFTGLQFDPTIVEAFLSVPIAAWRDIRESVHRQTSGGAEPDSSRRGQARPAPEPERRRAARTDRPRRDWSR